jgi:hypothetical protein
LSSFIAVGQGSRSNPAAEQPHLTIKVNGGILPDLPEINILWQTAQFAGRARSNAN